MLNKFFRYTKEYTLMNLDLIYFCFVLYFISEPSLTWAVLIIVFCAMSNASMYFYERYSSEEGEPDEDSLSYILSQLSMNENIKAEAAFHKNICHLKIRASANEGNALPLFTAKIDMRKPIDKMNLALLNKFICSKQKMP